MLSLEENWECLESEQERTFFLLASFFPEGTPVPLWLLGLAAGAGGAPSKLISRACQHLQAVGLFEEVTDERIQLSSTQRQFGREHWEAAGIQGKVLVAEATQHLFSACWRLDTLQQRALHVGYQKCREQVHCIRLYLDWLGSKEFSRLIEQLECWMSLESPHFTKSTARDILWWPEVLPDLFCQQLYNRSVEADCPLIMHEEATQWLRLIRKVGADSFRLLPYHSRRSNSIVMFSPDGRLALTSLTSFESYSFPREVRLWDIESERELQGLQGLDRINSAAFSLKGRLVGTSKSETGGTLFHLWEVESGCEPRQLDIPWSSLRIKALSLDGRLALTSSDKYLYNQEDLQIWEVESGREVGHLKGPRVHPATLHAVFSPDGRLVLTRSDGSDGIARLWEVESGRQIRQFEGDSWTTSMAFSPDGRLVLISSERIARLWEVESGRQIRQFEGHTFTTSMAFSPDGRLALTCGMYDRTVLLWEVESGRQIRQLGHQRPVTNVAFSQDGQWILTASWDALRRWPMETKEPCLWGKDRPETIEKVVFSPNGRLALSCSSSDEIARLWEVENGQLRWRLQDQMESSPASFVPWKVLLHFCSRDRLYDLWKGLMERMYPSRRIRDAMFSPDGRFILTGSERIARLWEVESGRWLRQLEGHTGTITSVVFSPDGRLALTGSEDGTARLWEVSSGRCLRRLRHKAEVNRVTFSPDGQFLLTCSLGARIHLWKASNGRHLRQFERDKWSYRITSVAFSPDGRLVLTSSTDGETARLWEVNNGHYLQHLQGHTFGINTVGINTVAFSPDGKLALSGSGSSARVFEVESGQVLAALPHDRDLECVAFSPDGHLLTVCDKGGRVYFYRGQGPDLGKLLGIYIAPQMVGAMSIYWQQPNQMILAEKGGLTWRPHFYHLMLDGKWD